MQIAPKPENEANRLKALETYRILDSAAEPNYDDIARLAAQICDTPVALITMIDQDRQWFKSTVGTDLSETPREIAFCAHTILNKDVLMIEDLQVDPRFSGNPIVTDDPKARFYAGAPLITPEGEALGSLCVIDLKPRTLTPPQLVALRVLARQVSSQLELRRQNYQILNQQEMLIEQAKMSALGLMACGVAHEINNPLTVIKTKAYIVKEKFAGTENADYISKACDVISATSDRISKIVRSLQALSQNDDSVGLQSTPLSLLVDEAVSLSKIRSNHQGVTLSYDLEKFMKIEVNVNPVQIGQVLLNLLNNSFDAVAALEEKWIELRVEQSEADVVLRIIDSGHGLSSEAQANLFQPFFTTKKLGVGTGLGLSLSRQMVEKQRGQLRYLATEKNTTFEVVLPKAG